MVQAAYEMGRPLFLKTNREIQQGKSIVILEVAILDVKAGQENEFEISFAKAQDIIAGMPGYVSHQLQRSIEQPRRYILLVNWQTLEDHTVGFRKSEQYQQWRALLHHYYDPFPEVEHYTAIYDNVAHVHSS
jgi:heme-degrading monooxygenase HmoA